MRLQVSTEIAQLVERHENTSPDLVQQKGRKADEEAEDWGRWWVTRHLQAIPRTNTQGKARTMDALPASYVSDAPQREPKNEAEKQLLKELHIMFMVYDFTRPDRVSLSRAIIAALEAAENS